MLSDSQVHLLEMELDTELDTELDMASDVTSDEASGMALGLEFDYRVYSLVGISDLWVVEQDYWL